MQSKTKPLIAPHAKGNCAFDGYHPWLNGVFPKKENYDPESHDHGGFQGWH